MRKMAPNEIFVKFCIHILLFILAIMIQIIMIEVIPENTLVQFLGIAGLSLLVVISIIVQEI